MITGRRQKNSSKFRDPLMSRNSSPYIFSTCPRYEGFLAQRPESPGAQALDISSEFTLLSTFFTVLDNNFENENLPVDSTMHTLVYPANFA
jgi:hypothetical protein